MKRSFYKFFIVFLIFLSSVGIFAQDRGASLQKALGLDSAVGKQWAVFIAIDRYREWAPLTYPVRDAKEIRDILRENYYIDEVRELYDAQATAEGIRQLLVNLRSQVGKDDSVFVFYAGHGYLDSNTNTGSWIPADGGSDKMVQANWLPNIQIRNILSQLPAKHVFLISDSCFSGDILDTNRVSSSPQINEEHYRRAYNRVSRQVMTSGASETVPDRSEFAMRLKSGLRRAEGVCIDPDYLFTTAGVREVKTTQPILGVIRGSEHQEGGSFLFFRKQTIVIEQSVPEGLEFEIVDGKSVTITSYTGDAATVNIPEKIQGLPVTVIGDNAFCGHIYLTSITIPSFVTTIGNRAFFECDKLTSINIPSSVTYISYGGVSGGDSLTVITVDSRNPSFTAIGGVLFDKNAKVILQYPRGKKGAYTIPSSVTAIGDFAFSGCNNLTNVTIPSSVTTIGDYAFSSSKISSVTIPSSITTIGYFSFRGCDNLTSVTIPSYVTNIGAWAFFGCDKLSSINIPSSVMVIGPGGVSGGDSLTGITVDSRNPSFTGIGEVLFDKNAKTIIQYPRGKKGAYTIPSSVATIGDWAFSDCNNLTSLTIPSSVTTIGGYAFQSCDNLTSVTIPSSVTTIGDRAFSLCDKLTSVTIPSSVTTIGNEAFFLCDKLTSVTIPSSVTTIGNHAFYLCLNLTSVTLSRKTQVGKDAFPDSVKIRYRD